jgi:hypothetical protein
MNKLLQNVNTAGTSLFFRIAWVGGGWRRSRCLPPRPPLTLLRPRSASFDQPARTRQGLPDPHRHPHLPPTRPSST